MGFLHFAGNNQNEEKEETAHERYVDSVFYWEPLLKIVGDFEKIFLLKERPQTEHNLEKIAGLEYRMGQRLMAFNALCKDRGIETVNEKWMWEVIDSQSRIDNVRKNILRCYTDELPAASITILID